MIGAFFVDTKGGYGKIEGGDAYHLLKVLRLKVGDSFPIIDSKGFKGKALIVSIEGPSSLTFRIVELESYNPEFPFCVTLAQSPIKGKRLSFLLQKVTELGITEIAPIISERTVVRDVNIQRWKKIVEEASKQSFRIFIPKIRKEATFEKFIENAKDYTTKVILSPSSDMHIREFMELLSPPKDLVFLVGPEGGFTEEELDYAKSFGFHEVSLGKRILRAETSPLVFLSILEYKWGRL